MAKEKSAQKKKSAPRIAYAEPDDYFPKDLRKKYKLGEYAETEEHDPSQPLKVNLNDYSTEEIDKLFETVPPGAVFTGTGYGMKEPPNRKKLLEEAENKSTKKITVDIVKAVVDKYDPEWFLGACCPDDEYDIEIEMIFDRIQDDMTAQEIAEIIHSVFLKMCNDPLETELCNTMACEMLDMSRL